MYKRQGNGHTGGSEPSSSSQVHGEFTIIKDNGNLLRAGYIFVNWNTEPNGSGTSYSVGDSISFTSNITLYAQWQVVYTVSYTHLFCFNSNLYKRILKYAIT